MGYVEVTRAFFDAHVEAHPEESSTFGVREHDGRLHDPSPAAGRLELTRLRASLRDAHALLASKMVDRDGELDLDAIVRFASFRARDIEDDLAASNLELATLPSSALRRSALHARSDGDWAALAARSRAVPAFLETHRENLRRGAKERRAPDAAVVRAFLARVLPGATEAVAALPALAKARGVADEVVAAVAEGARAASEAYGAFARFVGDVVLPVAPDHVRLGEREVALRLRETMGVERSPADLLSFAKEELARARRRLEEAIGARGPDVATKVEALFYPRPASVDEAVVLYERHLDAATRLVREHDLLRLPDRLALELAPLPPGIADGAALTNWPAPLLDPEGRGHALYATELAPHASVQAKNLAVHEGIPGHYLQSVSWQRQRVDRGRAVRWIGVADDVASSRGYFGAMLSIEGWAVYAEQLMREHGFYAPGAETAFFSLCDAIRATRVVLDLELQAGDIDDASAEQLVAESTFMHPTWARSAVLRAKRMPLQGATYLVGAREILDLRARRPKDEALPAFHARLLGAGPVPLSRL